MNIKEFGETIEFNIAHGLRHAILGLGAPGVGKSQLIRQIGKKYDYKVIDIRLAQMSEVEIGGLIYPNQERTKTVWLSPDILPDEKRDGPRTILLLDEITSCPKRTQVAAYQLILDRRIGQYHLPEGTLVVALGNREDDDGVYIRLAGPLADRFEIHYIDVDFECWKNDYAVPFGVHPWVVEYLTSKPQALHNQAEAGDSMVFATPRSWDRVSQILKTDDNVRKTVIANKIIGNVGESVGRQFVQWCMKQRRPISVDAYLNGQIKAPNAPDQLRTLVTGLTTKCSFLKQHPETAPLSGEQKKTLSHVVEALLKLNNDEFTMMGLHQLMDMNRTAVKQALGEFDAPEVYQFINRNRALLGLKDEKQPDSERARWLEMWR